MTIHVHAVNKPYSKAVVDIKLLPSVHFAITDDSQQHGAKSLTIMLTIYDYLLQRSVCRPKKRFIDHNFANLLKCNIKPSDLEALANDRDIWRIVCDTGLRSFLNGWITTSEERRAARHTASTKPKTGPRCPQCSRVCASDYGLRSHMRSHDKTGNT